MVDLEDPVTLINAHLPPQIRVMAVKRVTKGFDSRYNCGGRTYEYLMPTYAFAPPHMSNAEYRIPGQVTCMWLTSSSHVYVVNYQTALWSWWTTYCSVMLVCTIIIISLKGRNTATNLPQGMFFPLRFVNEQRSMKHSHETPTGVTPESLQCQGWFGNRKAVDTRLSSSPKSESLGTRLSKCATKGPRASKASGSQCLN